NGVLDVETPSQLGPLSGRRRERELAREKVAERGDFQVGPGHPVPSAMGMGIDARGVEADPDEGSAERVGDRQAAADDAAVLLFLAAVERELFLCGAVCCGIEAPPLPG